MVTTADRNASTLLQLSAFTQYFFPFGNFIFPAIIWSLKKKDSEFVDYNGKQALNFQLSLFLYTLTLLIITIPVILYCAFNNISYINWDSSWMIKEISAGNISGMVILGIIASLLFLSLKVAEFFLIVYASVKNSNGEKYNYPLTIKFIK